MILISFEHLKEASDFPKLQGCRSKNELATPILNLIIIIIMKSFISDPEQVRVTFFQSYIHYRYKKLFFTVFEYILWDIL